MRRVLLMADSNGVAGSRAAPIAHDDVGILGEKIDDLAFAFVSPLKADDAGVAGCERCHARKVGAGGAGVKRTPRAPRSARKRKISAAIAGAAMAGSGNSKAPISNYAMLWRLPSSGLGSPSKSLSGAYSEVP